MALSVYFLISDLLTRKDVPEETDELRLIMCILFLHTDPKPSSGKYKLILASNRDEYFRRPTKVAHYWEEDATVIGGRDMQPGRDGGTWLAMSTNGRIAALLNITGEPVDDPSSLLGRGFLVADFVTNKHRLSQQKYLENIAKDSKKYSPYNFVAITIGNNKIEIQQQSNSSRSTGLPEKVENGTRGWGNCTFDRPFRKVTAGTEKFVDIIKNRGDVKEKNILVQELLELLKWDKRHLPDEELEQRALQCTRDVIEKTSAVFISSPQSGYGTRTHTIILVDDKNNVDYIEWTMKEPIDPEHPTWTSAKFSTKLKC